MQKTKSNKQQHYCNKNQPRNKSLPKANVLTLLALAIFVAVISAYQHYDSKYYQQISVVFIAYAGYTQMQETVLSFYSTFDVNLQLGRVILVYDGMQSQDLKVWFNYIAQSVNRIVDKNYDPNNQAQDMQIKNINPIEFYTTGNNNGQLSAIDFAFSKIQKETQFVMLILGDWKFRKTGYMEEALAVIKGNQDISQVVISDLMEQVSPPQLGRAFLLEDTLYVGFSLLPSLHRFAIYKQIQGGYSHLTGNITFQKSTGQAEKLISMYYYNSGYSITELNDNYIQKSPTNNYLYQPLKFAQQILYKTLAKTHKQEKQLCSATIEQNKFKQMHYSLKRQKKKLLNRLIKLEKGSIDLYYQPLGISTSIQVGSEMDYLSLKNDKKYQYIVEYFPRTLHLQHFFFKERNQNQKAYTIIANKYFENYPQAIQYIQNQLLQGIKPYSSQSTKLAVKLFLNQHDTKAQQAQYLHHAQNYGIQRTTKQLDLCIFIEGYQLFSRADMRRLINSIDIQNYTNYKVVYSGDENEDYSAGRLKEVGKYINKNVFNRLRNIVKNQYVLGTGGNHFLRMKQFCKGTDVVITLNGNSALVGKQAFNVVNAAFQNQNTWMVFFNPIKNVNGLYAASDPIDANSNFREIGVETDDQLVAFRYDLGSKLPIEYVFEFNRDDETSYLKPSFYLTESNRFHIYSYAQMSGSSRIKNMMAPIYFYKQLDPVGQTCWKQKQQWIKAKALLKYPLKRLVTIESPIQIDTSKMVPLTSLYKIRKAYQKVQNCENSKALLQIKKKQQAKYQSPLNILLNKTLQKMEVANYYISSIQINKIQPMPFCLLVWAGKNKTVAHADLILKSIVSSGYRNYTILVVHPGNNDTVKVNVQKSSLRWESIYNVSLPSQSYFDYLKITRSMCTQNSLIMFLNNPLKREALQQLNTLHQRQNSWMTYSVTNRYVQIHSLYMRVFQLIQMNDFQRTNSIYLQKGDQQIETLAILQMCQKASSRLQEASVYSQLDKNPKPEFWLRAYIYNQKGYARNSYQYLQTLSQDLKVNLNYLQQKLQQFHQSKIYLSRPNKRSYLTKTDFLQAYQYQQLPYLPDNHMLSIREYQYLQKNYEISKYMTGQYKDKQTRFCFTIFGRNNTENYRVQKNLRSVLMQNYSNYHIVFMDDVSDDDTLEQAMDYLRKAGFPSERVKFVKNKQRTFATYNIINAAFNYCGEDDVQVRLDGDDELIGRNIFGLINAIYLKNPEYWIVYNSFKSNEFTYGIGFQTPDREQMLNCRGGRMRTHFIAPLATWKVKLIRAIPLKYHKDQSNMWLRTLYDDALQFPFIQLSTLKRIKYVPYLSYNYNTNYGSNDNSDMQKIKDRIALFEYVLSMDSLQPLKDLNDKRTKNYQVEEVLKKDHGVVFQTVKL